MSGTASDLITEMIDATFRIHDVTDFPIVRTRRQGWPAGYSAAWIEEMEALIRQRQPFCILLLDAPGGESVEDVKARTVWLRRNKEALASVCRAFISIEPNSVARIAQRTQAALITKGMGFNIEVVRGLLEAEETARRLTKE